MKLCRCCKTRLNGECYYEVDDDDEYGKSMPTTFVEFIKKWLDVSIGYDDGLPQKTCAFCYNKLKLILDFVTKIKESNERLKNQLETEDENKPSTSKKSQRRLCRCCLSTKATQYHDLDKVYLKPGVTYAAIINDMAQLQICNDDGLTKNLCHNCSSTVENIFDFGLNIRYVDKALRKQAWRPILKTECRCCRNAKAEKYHSVYEKMKNGQKYADYICQITWNKVTIKKNDGFPQRICSECLRQLDNLLSFGLSVLDNIKSLQEDSDDEDMDDERVCRFCGYTNPGAFSYRKTIEHKIKPDFSYGCFLELLLSELNLFGYDKFDLSDDVCDDCVDRVKPMFYFTRNTIVLTDEQLRQLKPWKMSNRSDTDDSNVIRRYKGSSNSEDSDYSM